MKRAHVPMQEIAASALADKLPIEERDRLRAAEVPAQNIIRMFTPDHVCLHAWGGSDKWWNLDMRRRGEDLKKKDAADTSRAAKAVRIRRAEDAHENRILARKRGEPRPPSRWSYRPLRSKNNLRRNGER